MGKQAFQDIGPIFAEEPGQPDVPNPMEQISGLTESPSLPPPPERSDFISRNEALHYAQQWAREHGYGLAIKNSTDHNTKGRRATTYVICDHGGRPRRSNRHVEDRRRRFTGSRKLNCPFCLKLRMLDDIYWELVVTNPNHNHGPSSASAHPCHRRQARRAVKDSIREHLAAGLKTSKSVALLQAAQPDPLPMTMRDLYNERHAMIQEELHGLLPVQVLLMEFDGRYYLFHERDSINRLTRVAFFHKESLKLLQSFPELLLMDSTYNTNRFNLPLVHITGQTCLNQTFLVGGAFMRENEESYVWLLEQLIKVYRAHNLDLPHTLVTDADRSISAARRRVLPKTNHMLCIWHVKRNIQATAKKHIKLNAIRAGVADDHIRNLVEEEWATLEEDCNKVLHASSIENFEDAWDSFQQKHRPKYISIVDYIKNQWLSKKEQIIPAWTDKHLHYGIRATSRIESFHKVIKNELPSRKAHLRDVLTRLHEYLSIRINDTRQAIEKERFTHYPGLDNFIFKDCLRVVSSYALKLVKKELDALSVDERSPLPHCTGRFKSSMGLPCRHTLKQRKACNESLKPDDFDARWYLSLEASTAIDPRILVQEPETIVRSHSPAKQSFTGRILSTFEQVDDELNSVGRKGSSRARGARRGGHGSRGRGRGGPQQQRCKALRHCECRRWYFYNDASGLDTRLYGVEVR